MDIKNILVPCDFSPPSRLAVNYAIWLARQLRAQLTLMHVVESPEAVTHTVAATFKKVGKDSAEQAERMLSSMVAPEDQDDLDLRIIVKTGHIEYEILSTIVSDKADVVVMGTHGRSLFGRWFIGSITQDLLRKAQVPILTVCRISRPYAFKRILFATDFSDASRQAFNDALQIAGKTKAELQLLHVIEATPPPFTSVEALQYLRTYSVEEARTKLEEMVTPADRKKSKVGVLAVKGDAAAHEILKAADDTNSDLIVIGHEHKGLVERALLGSTAERVIREARVPVLALPLIPQSAEQTLPDILKAG